MRNNAGGHANHSFFWKNLKTGTTLGGDLKAAIERDFGSVEKFRKSSRKPQPPASVPVGPGWC